MATIFRSKLVTAIQLIDTTLFSLFAKLCHERLIGDVDNNDEEMEVGLLKARVWILNCGISLRKGWTDWDGSHLSLPRCIISLYFCGNSGNWGNFYLV